MTQAARTLPIGVASTRAVANVYYPSTLGYISAASHVASSVMQLPFYGIISLSADGNPITLTTGGRSFEYRALAFCGRDLEFSAAGTRFVAIGVNPLHENFRAFTRLKAPYVLQLDRKMFSPLDALLRDAVDGTLPHQQSVELFDRVQAIVRPHLPITPKLDARANALVKELWANPRSSVDELASSLGLSYDRTSHFFAEAIGIPIRTYLLWQKLYKAGGLLLSGATLTEAAHGAGFVDSAHYSSAFHRAYGQAPSDLHRSRSVSINTIPSVRQARAGNPLEQEPHPCEARPSNVQQVGTRIKSHATTLPPKSPRALDR
jgi:AraC-like DNA-binding protein